MIWSPKPPPHNILFPSVNNEMCPHVTVTEKALRIHTLIQRLSTPKQVAGIRARDTLVKMDIHGWGTNESNVVLLILKDRSPKWK